MRNTPELVAAHRLLAPVLYSVGDKVRIVRKIPSYTYGWENSWPEPMDAMIGKEYEIQSIGTSGLLIAGWWFGLASVALVEKGHEGVVVLNHEYTAKVTPDGVEVGCQHFTKGKALELADTIKRIIKA